MAIRDIGALCGIGFPAYRGAASPHDFRQAARTGVSGEIPSAGMEPTLLVGDHIIVDKLGYRFRFPNSLFTLIPFANRIPYGKF